MTASTDQRALVDTNVVVYAYDPTDPTKHARARALLAELSNSGLLVFSAEVLNEFCAVMLRPGKTHTLTPHQASVRLSNLAATGDVVPLTAQMTLLAMDAVARHGLSFWDALIWAAARESDIHLIYTEDFQHGREVDGVRFLNPFVPGG
jgi:predicted nucleic acid-binding protein